MNGKLTLTIDKSLIEKAKVHSKNIGKSPSQMIAGLLLNLTQDAGNDAVTDGPIVSELLGSFKEKQHFLGKKSQRKSASKPEKE